MRKVARPLALIAVALVGCSFDSAGSNDSNPLAPSSGSGDVESTGSDETSDTQTFETDGIGGTTSVGNDEACVDACVPTPPGAWRGPFHVVRAANPVDCPEGYARQDLGFSGLIAEPPSCSCSCIEGESTCAVEYQASGNSLCALAVSGSLSHGACDTWPALADIHARGTVVGNPPSCVPDLQVEVAAPSWSEAATLCAAPARGGSCGDDACVAAAPDSIATEVCIANDGDQDCPEGPYSERQVVYRSVNDARTCEGCECSGSTECVGEFRAYNQVACDGNGDVIELDSCEDLPVSGGYSLGATFEPTTCAASEVVAAGEAEPAEPVTICCAP